jgi:hypothetical protein
MPTLTPTYALRFILSLLVLIFALLTAAAGIHTLSPYWYIVVLAFVNLVP